MTGTPRRPATLPEPLHFLDRGWLLDWLAPIGRRDVRLCEVTPEYVRAKRGQSLLMGVRIGWETESGRLTTRGSIYASSDGTDDAWFKAQTLRHVEPAAGPALARLMAPDALFLAFPNDRALRGLSAAADPRRLGNRLSGAAFPFNAAGLRVSARRTTVTPARWKVGRRAVLHAQLALRHCDDGAKEMRDTWVRVYPADALAQQRARWTLAAEHARECRVPAVLGVDHERGFLLTAAEIGDPITAVRRGETGLDSRALEADQMEAIRTILAPLHQRAGDARAAALLPTVTAPDVLEASLRPLSDLAAWVPEWAPRIGRIANALRAAMPAAPAEGRLIHGDFKVDQLLSDRGALCVLDWDELAIGDPLIDYASLAADLALSGAGFPTVAVTDAPAVRCAPARFSDAAWRWHLAAAGARRALAGLQGGRSDWELRAAGALDWVAACLPQQSAPRTRPSTAGGRPEAAPPARREPVNGWPAALLDRCARAAELGLPDGTWRLDAVWPDGSAVLARLTHPASGVTHWCRCDRRTESWRSPADPCLPRLERLVASGTYRLVAHRLGRRAALRSAGDGGTFIHLRDPRRAPAVLARVSAVHASLAAAGVPLPPAPVSLAAGDGWRVPAVPGAPFDPTTAATATWTEVGEVLARVHRAAPPAALPRRGRDRARRDMERQAALRMRANDSFGQWLMESLEGFEPGFTSPETAGATVHGDLHPAQILCAGSTTWLDWEQAGAGEPEEDLGNLAAHLYWWSGGSVRPNWLALRERYEQQGGVVRHDALRAYARMALLRLLSVHSWRDADRSRCEGRMDLWARWAVELGQW